MNTLPIDLYKVIEYGLGGDTWQEFIDRYKEKYDLLQIDGFEFEATKLDYTFSQLITSLGVKTLPAYVDPESPGYEAALGELEGRTGNIPTQKKFYREPHCRNITVATGRHVRIDLRCRMCSWALDEVLTSIGLQCAYSPANENCFHG
ncbi:MAG: hypothetical protein ACLUGY_24065 [Phocaeicola massiliensis]